MMLAAGGKGLLLMGPELHGQRSAHSACTGYGSASEQFVAAQATEERACASSGQCRSHRAGLPA